MAGSEVGAECQLLEPVCLRVTVARNLSASWYHGSADVEVLGQLQEISVSQLSGCLNQCWSYSTSLFIQAEFSH